MEDQEEVETPILLTMIREAGLMVEDTLLRNAGISCRTMTAEDLEAADMKVAAHLVPVVGF